MLLYGKPCRAPTSAARAPQSLRTRGIMSAAPKTGQHTVADTLKDEALSFFFDDDSLKVTPTVGGVNNVVNFVETKDGHRYILRIYNNGNKSAKVQFEHSVLRQLRDQQDQLSFAVPTALKSKDGRDHVLLSNGAEACIFEIIPGTLAKTTSPQEVGRATGELCTAMSKVKLEMEPPIAPYYDVFAVHWSMNRDLFYKEVAENKAFDVCREPIDYLTAQIRDIEAKLEEFKKLGLPEQVIHGDLHYDNVMVLGDSVSGLLDFEFCAYDWRIMELAVALSKYVGEDQPLPLIEDFVSGYVKHGELTDAEIQVLPDLINLRIFSNVIYFTGRAYAKEDGIDSLTSRAGTYAKRVKWINANRQAIVDCVRGKIAVLHN